MRGPGNVRAVPDTRVASSEEVRRHNLGLLLRLLHVEGAASRSGLGARTGLNRSTVGTLASALAEAGLVQESAPEARGGMGRPSIQVQPCSSTHVLAVEIGVERLTAARIGLGGVVLQHVELAQRPGDHEPLTTVARVLGLLDRLIEGTPPGGLCLGVGVAVCGLVRAEDGTVRRAPNLGWVDVPLRELLSAHLPAGLSVVVGNEADLGARAEHLRGAGAGARDMVYLSGEVGVGGGIVLGGRPLTGAGGYAGELGHVVVNPAGRPCPCGRTGCWETEIGEQAVLRAAGQPERAGRRGVLDACASEDPAVRAGLDRVGRWLGLGVANLVNLLNPEVVVFGGLTGDIFPVVEATVRAALDEALVAPRAEVRLALPGLGSDSNLFGAGELVFAPLLDDPLGVVGDALGRAASS